MRQVYASNLLQKDATENVQPMDQGFSSSQVGKRKMEYNAAKYQSSTLLPSPSCVPLLSRKSIKFRRARMKSCCCVPHKSVWGLFTQLLFFSLSQIFRLLCAHFSHATESSALQSFSSTWMNYCILMDNLRFRDSADPCEVNHCLQCHFLNLSGVWLLCWQNGFLTVDYHILIGRRGIASTCLPLPGHLFWKPAWLQCHFPSIFVPL